MLDSALVGSLVEILKTSPPNLQRKAASILEFIALTNPTMDLVISVDIESGLDAVFQQEVLKGKTNTYTVKFWFCKMFYFIYAVSMTSFLFKSYLGM